MVETEVSFTSLCYIKEDYDGRTWLQRLADIEDGKLHTPFKSNRADYYFENRDQLFPDPDGPSDVGKVGLWDWSAIPARDNPKIDYVQSYYRQDISPIRVVVVIAIKSLEDLVEQLKVGAIRTQPYFCDTLFCYQPQWGRLEGVLCKSNEFQIDDKRVKISTDIYSLPQYSIHTKDIYNWDDKNLRFLRDLQIGAPLGYVSLKNSHDVIRSLILERSTWPLFKECVGATKADWRNSKKLLEKICDESLYEAIANRLKYTDEQARQAVDDFVAHADVLIDASDVDADVLAQIAMNHDELRRQCEEVVSAKWKETHAAEMANAEQEIQEAKKRLEDAAASREELVAQIDSAQDELEKLHSQIEQYDALGKDTLAAVRKKIAEAQKDVAGFIADISVYLPQINTTLPQEGQSASWQYTNTREDQYSDDIELAENWQNEFDTIHQNLVQALGGEPELCAMLTAFLYSAHINNVPLLIAGPGGCDIAEVLSVSMYAASAGQLTLDGKCDVDIADKISQFGDSVVAIKNMFGKDWNDTFPQAFAKFKGQTVWTHPYVEDMGIEPKGLYNYMIPILSECFIENPLNLEIYPGKRNDNFQPYVSEKKRPLRISAFKQLGLSKLLLNQLTCVFSDAKGVLEEPSKDKDMEILFGLIPLCVLTERLDILKDVIEHEDGISKSVKDEAARYIQEE